MEDYDLWLRMLKSPSIRMTNLPRVVLRLRKHEHNISRVRANEQRENALIVNTNALCVRLGRQLEKSHVRSFRRCTRDGIETEQEALDVIER